MSAKLNPLPCREPLAADVERDDGNDRAALGLRVAACAALRCETQQRSRQVRDAHAPADKRPAGFERSGYSGLGYCTLVATSRSNASRRANSFSWRREMSG